MAPKFRPDDSRATDAGIAVIDNRPAKVGISHKAIAPDKVDDGEERIFGSNIVLASTIKKPVDFGGPTGFSPWY